MSQRVAVVGAGITGLAAAFELRRAGLDAVVLEAGDRPGGKVDGSAVGGLTVDSGPDGFLARDPDAADLCRRLGLGADLVAPASGRAFVWADGDLRPLPDQSVLGAPFTADAVAGRGIVSAAGAEALRRGLAWDAPPLAGDASVGDVLRPRLGDEVFERLVDPLLGGINAGSADRMSIEACAAPLHEAARPGGPFGPALSRVAAARSAGPDGGTPGPVFQSVRGGAARIVDALAAELGDAVRLGTPVESLSSGPPRQGAGRGWTLATPDGPVAADSVILATPAWETARLLEPHAPDAAEILGGIEYSDVVLVTFVAGAEHVLRPLDGSGFLVPRGQGLLTTACSWSSSKWEHYRRPGLAVLRVSAGRTDDRRWLNLDPAGLAAALAAELAEMGLIADLGPAATTPADLGPAATTPADTNGRFAVRVTPWRRSLPQYLPGHLERVAAVEACLAADAPGLVATGAAFRGLGLPACIRQGHAAAATLMAAALC